VADGERTVQVKFKDHDSGELQAVSNSSDRDSDDDLELVPASARL
jgi:hypothetical protein